MQRSKGEEEWGPTWASVFQTVGGWSALPVAVYQVWGLQWRRGGCKGEEGWGPTWASVFQTVGGWSALPVAVY